MQICEVYDTSSFHPPFWFTVVIHVRAYYSQASQSVLFVSLFSKLILWVVPRGAKKQSCPIFSHQDWYFSEDCRKPPQASVYLEYPCCPPCSYVLSPSHFFRWKCSTDANFSVFSEWDVTSPQGRPPNILLDFPSGFNTWMDRNSVQYKFFVQGNIHRPANFRRIREMERTG